MYHHFLFLIAFLFLFPFAYSLGINCRGSFECADTQFSHFDPSYNLFAGFNEALSDGRSYWIPGGPAPSKCRWAAGDHIVCSPSGFGVRFGGICLFAQGNVPAEGIGSEIILQRIDDLYNHGCQVCGSVPISGDNDPDKMGTLTSNYISGTSCLGVCDHVC